jgi:hypothetical protein
MCDIFMAFGQDDLNFTFINHRTRRGISLDLNLESFNFSFRMKIRRGSVQLIVSVAGLPDVFSNQKS